MPINADSRGGTSKPAKESTSTQREPHISAQYETPIPTGDDCPVQASPGQEHVSPSSDNTSPDPVQNQPKTDTPKVKKKRQKRPPPPPREPSSRNRKQVVPFQAHQVQAPVSLGPDARPKYPGTRLPSSVGPEQVMSSFAFPDNSPSLASSPDCPESFDSTDRTPQKSLSC